MLTSTLSIVTDLVREAAHPLTGSVADYDALLDSIGEIGRASCRERV